MQRNINLREMMVNRAMKEVARIVERILIEDDDVWSRDKSVETPKGM